MIVHRAACSTSAEQPAVDSVEFVVGDFLKSEGGTATPEDSPLIRPFGIDFDSQGRMYVVELEGGRIHRLTSGSELEVISGDGSKSYQGDGGPVRNATFNGMHNIAINQADKAFIADSWNHCVREIDLQSGLIKTIAGNGSAGFSGDGQHASNSTFNYLMCVSLNQSGRFSVYRGSEKPPHPQTRSGHHDGLHGCRQRCQGGSPRPIRPATASPLVDPRAVAVDSTGNIYILERSGHALAKSEPGWPKLQTVAGTGSKGYQDGPAMQAQFGSPKHLCVDDQRP